MKLPDKINCLVLVSALNHCFISALITKVFSAHSLSARDDDPGGIYKDPDDGQAGHDGHLTANIEWMNSYIDAQKKDYKPKYFVTGKHVACDLFNGDLANASPTVDRGICLFLDGTTRGAILELKEARDYAVAMKKHLNSEYPYVSAVINYGKVPDIYGGSKRGGVIKNDQVTFTYCAGVCVKGTEQMNYYSSAPDASMQEQKKDDITWQPDDHEPRPESYAPNTFRIVWYKRAPNDQKWHFDYYVLNDMGMPIGIGEQRRWVGVAPGGTVKLTADGIADIEATAPADDNGHWGFSYQGKEWQDGSTFDITRAGKTTKGVKRCGWWKSPSAGFWLGEDKLGWGFGYRSFNCYYVLPASD